jgi:hypothetical protein
MQSPVLSPNRSKEQEMKTSQYTFMLVRAWILCLAFAGVAAVLYKTGHSSTDHYLAIGSAVVALVLLVTSVVCGWKTIKNSP